MRWRIRVFSSVDNVTNINYWHYVANTAGEPAFGDFHELSPNGRELTGGAYNANVAEWGFVGTFAPFADPLGGLGVDGRQGVWTYTAWAIDLAGNQSATSAPLAITYDTVAPLTPVLDLPAVEDSGFSSSDNVTNVQPWHFYANVLVSRGSCRRGRSRRWVGICSGRFRRRRRVGRVVPITSTRTSVVVWGSTSGRVCGRTRRMVRI